MATEVGKLRINLTGDSSEFNKSLKDAETNIKGFSVNIKQIGSAITAVGASMMVGLTTFLYKSAQAAAEEEMAFKRLEASLATVGISYADVSGDVEKLYSSLQKTTIYGDTETVGALQNLISLTGSYEISMQGVAHVFDFASARQLDYNTAARLVGQAIQGNVGSLSRYGIVLDQATQEQLKNSNQAERANIIYELLNKKFGGAAQAELNTYTGQIKQLKNYWVDFMENVGKLLLPALTELAKKLTEVAKWLTTLDPVTQKVILVIGGLTAVITTLGGSSLLLISYLPKIAAGLNMVSAAGVTTKSVGLVKWFIDITTRAAQAQISVSSLGIALGKGGLVVAVGAASYALGTLAVKLLESTSAGRKFIEVQDRINTSILMYVTGAKKDLEAGEAYLQKTRGMREAQQQYYQETLSKIAVQKQDTEALNQSAIATENLTEKTNKLGISGTTVSDQFKQTYQQLQKDIEDFADNAESSWDTAGAAGGAAYVSAFEEKLAEIDYGVGFSASGGAGSAAEAGIEFGENSGDTLNTAINNIPWGSFGQTMGNWFSNSMSAFIKGDFASGIQGVFGGLFGKGGMLDNWASGLFGGGKDSPLINGLFGGSLMGGGGYNAEGGWEAGGFDMKNFAGNIGSAVSDAFGPATDLLGEGNEKTGAVIDGITGVVGQLGPYGAIAAGVIKIGASIVGAILGDKRDEWIRGMLDEMKTSFWDMMGASQENLASAQDNMFKEFHDLFRRFGTDEEDKAQEALMRWQGRMQDLMKTWEMMMSQGGADAQEAMGMMQRYRDMLQMMMERAAAERNAPMYDWAKQALAELSGFMGDTSKENKGYIDNLHGEKTKFFQNVNEEVDSNSQATRDSINKIADDNATAITTQSEGLANGITNTLEDISNKTIDGMRNMANDNKQSLTLQNMMVRGYIKRLGDANQEKLDEMSARHDLIAGTYQTALEKSAEDMHAVLNETEANLRVMKGETMQVVGYQQKRQEEYFDNLMDALKDWSATLGGPTGPYFQGGGIMGHTGMAMLHAGEVVMSNHALERLGRMYAMMFNEGNLIGSKMPGGDEAFEMVNLLRDIKGILASHGMGGGMTAYFSGEYNSRDINAVLSAIEKTRTSAYQGMDKPINVTTAQTGYPANLYKD